MTMNIIVCIKQVPGTTEVDIDPETGVLKRSGIASKMNPYDLYALETALRLKQVHGGQVAVVTMGPPQAESIVREAYAMGADEGVLLTDRRFAGSDVLATSYTLAQGIQQMGDYQLIICGKQTTDGDTAQVGPAIAEHLSIPHVTWVRSIDQIEADHMVVEQNMSDCFEVVRLPYPCLITVEKDIYTPRLPSYRRKKETVDKDVRIITLDDLRDRDPDQYGLNGSPTKVERVFQPSHNTDQIIWKDENGSAADALFNLLVDGKYIQEVDR